MHRLPRFAMQLLAVVIGIVFLVMAAAFVLIHYSMRAHLGETPALSSTASYHLT